MEHTVNYLVCIPLLPLAGAFVLGMMHMFTCKNPLPEKLYSFLAMLGPLGSLIFTLIVFATLREMPAESRYLTQDLFTWFSVGDLHVDMGFFADPLSTLFLLFVTFIGSLIHIYSIGYMAGEENFGKYFAYFNLFLGSMLILVLGNGPVVMFIGWEAVGLCSYLLISFYTKERDNVLAGNKAFIVNRVGDLGFVLGVAVLFWGLHSALGGAGFDYLNIKASASSLTGGAGLAVCLLLFLGATGKSAQIPLYVWLPDAMAGPTPVSALIHAATMVTAGVYMVARFSFLYASFPLAGDVVAWVGILTALLAAIIGCFQRDIKKILAYSTVSQLGYMFAGVGVAAYSAGIFHVFTHSFFKALLFLGAGSVIYGLHHEQDIWKMGGLKKKMPLTWIVMVIGALALAGFPPFAGFFSKDEILFMALAKGHWMIWLIGVGVAGLTAFYSFRLIFLVFHGEPRDQKSYEKAHEPPPVMTIPLIILAVGATFAGFFNLPSFFAGDSMVSTWLAPSLLEHHSEASRVTEGVAMVLSIAVVLLGIFYAWKTFAFKPQDKPLTGFAKWAEDKFYVDEFYNAFIVQPWIAFGRTISNFIEPNIVDFPIKGTAWLYGVLGMLFKVFQAGYVRVYAIYMVIGLSLMSIFLSQSL
ncbi:MAG: NADH-quinone oxidoreductase subunit L [Desulforhopalus sp.]|nr:NADH-quinone oxidoreductase subunit L [Desulforhopalus sp.]